MYSGNQWRSLSIWFSFSIQLHIMNLNVVMYYRQSSATNAPKRLLMLYSNNVFSLVISRHIHSEECTLHFRYSCFCIYENLISGILWSYPCTAIFPLLYFHKSVIYSSKNSHILKYNKILIIFTIFFKEKGCPC